MSEKKFHKDHIEGSPKQGKKINTVGDFDKPDKRYVSVRPSGADKGTRVPGTKPDQKKVVVENINYEETKKTKTGPEVRDGNSPFMVTGRKDGKNVKPEHLDGQVTKTKDGKYKTLQSDEFSECSSSTSAYYDGPSK